MASRRKSGNPVIKTSWDPVANWYSGWVGADGSKHHRLVAIPAVLELLAPQPGEQILDVGCGPGVLAPFLTKAGTHYTGVDASEKLIQFARTHHGKHGRFILGDAARLPSLRELRGELYDAAVFLLSIQDMHPLDAVLRSTASMLREDGRTVLLMTHPCFRVPRQSGWGWDETRKLRFRRVDRYLTELAVPMKTYGPEKHSATRSFHRPLEAYINSLAGCGLLVDRLYEIPSYRAPPHGEPASTEDLAHQEIPLFLALRARKLPWSH